MATILIVDDEFAIVEMLTAVLEEEGYQVISAQNGMEGLTCLKKVQPAMVLCDLMMPITTVVNVLY
jgi:CheY-like chemotaxis protein